MLFPEITGWHKLSFAKEMVIEEINNNSNQSMKSDYLSTKVYEDFTKILEEHYTDPELDIGKMAQLLFMSERTLYRKLKEIFGNSPNEVLLDFRLKRAYDAIQLEPNKTLGKIIKENGFLTNSYFARCFKKSYGILPSDFQRECRINNSSNKN